MYNTYYLYNTYNTVFCIVVPWLLHTYTYIAGSQGSNTGQVVAELKVVTSNKLCEPNASNCPNAPRHKHKERKHPRKKARTPKLLKLHEDAQRQSVERESASRPPPVLQLVGSQADSW